MSTLFPERRVPDFREQHPWAFVISDALRFSPDDDFEEARQFIDHWVNVYPDGDDKTDLANRLLGDNAQFIPAFYEVAAFAALCNAGFDAEPHPELDHSPRHPDFLAVRGELRLYAECATAGARDDDVAAERRHDEFLGELQRSRVPGYSLVLERLVTGRRAPSRRTLLTWVEERLARQVGEERDLGVWEFEDWRIGVSAVPDPEDTGGEGPIGMVIDSSSGSSAPKLAATIRGKQSAYGQIGRPYILVLGTSVIHASERELWDALFGSRTWALHENTRQVDEVRKPDGCWLGPAGVRGGAVSAILFAPALGPRSIRTASWTLVHHPAPEYPLPTGLFPFAAEHVWVDGLLTARPAIQAFAARG